jgi:CRISPR-associated endonuclease/helicase Cas3
VTLAAIDEDLDAIADLAASLALAGGCGAVVVNTVDRAQGLYRRLQTRMAGRLEPMLFHARYPADDRNIRERAVLATFGRDAARPRAALLVATQVVEQSLDIDFDFLISDLAPVDLLLQRAGRLHRHERERPTAHREPRLVVAGLRADRLPDLKTTAWGAIYGEFFLYRTWALASRERKWHMPQDIDRMVQAVYGNAELPASLDAKTIALIEGRAEGQHLAETQMERQLARNAVVDARADFDDAYVGKPRGSDEGNFPGVRNVTRLGPESLTVIPIHVDATGRWRIDLHDAPFDPDQAVDSEMARRLVLRQVRLSRHDLVKALKTQAKATAFGEHPWLMHSVPLRLHDNRCVLGALTIALDPQLGIVYNPPAPIADVSLPEKLKS